MYFLDTNICIYFLNGSSEQVRKRIMETSPDAIAIPAIVRAELLYGAKKSRKSLENLEKVERFLQPFPILPFDGRSTALYADLRTGTESRGDIVGPHDLLIGAIVMAADGILVTNNEKEFRRIEGLRIENWTR